MQKGLTSKLKSQEILYGSRQTFLFFRDVIQEIKKGIEKLPPYQSSKKDSENDLPPQLMLELPFYGSQKYKKQDVICYNEFASIEVHDQEKNNVKKEKKDKGFLPIVSLSEHSKVKDISAFSKNKQLLALPGITFTLLKWKATENEGKENIFVPLEKKHNTLPLKDSLNSSSLITEERSVGSQLKFLAGKLAPKKY